MEKPSDMAAAEELFSLYDACRLCPRLCGANRNAGKTGYCGMTASLTAARAALHMWEEPCISGSAGSGTVFFSGCSLQCIFCQNRTISAGRSGKEISEDRLADIFLELQDKGALNINLVTGAHYIPHIIHALDRAKKQGLRIPVLYNSSGYERVETLKLLKGYVDIYLPDFKYMDPDLAAKFSGARDYPDAAKSAIREMVRQTGPCIFDPDGKILRGTVVRHLILPMHTKDSLRVVEYLLKTYGGQIYISLMNQYTPPDQPLPAPELNRRVTDREYEKVLSKALELGLVNGFFQEGKTAEESFIPAFDNEGV